MIRNTKEWTTKPQKYHSKENCRRRNRMTLKRPFWVFRIREIRNLLSNGYPRMIFSPIKVFSKVVSLVAIFIFGTMHHKCSLWISPVWNQIEISGVPKTCLCPITPFLGHSITYNTDTHFGNFMQVCLILTITAKLSASYFFWVAQKKVLWGKGTFFGGTPDMTNVNTAFFYFRDGTWCLFFFLF